MGDSELFMVYSAQGRALQAVATHKTTDHNLARTLFVDMPRALYLEVENLRIFKEMTQIPVALMS